jgi:hypothetical protein
MLKDMSIFKRISYRAVNIAYLFYGENNPTLLDVQQNKGRFSRLIAA